jgi:hypothetical protein
MLSSTLSFAALSFSLTAQPFSHLKDPAGALDPHPYNNAAVMLTPKIRHSYSPLVSILYRLDTVILCKSINLHVHPWSKGCVFIDKFDQ